MIFAGNVTLNRTYGASGSARRVLTTSDVPVNTGIR